MDGTGMRVGDGQDPTLVAQGQLVMDKIHGLGVIRADSPGAIIEQLCFYPPLRMFVAQREGQVIVNPSGLLDVHLPSF